MLSENLFHQSLNEFDNHFPCFGLPIYLVAMGLGYAVFLPMCTMESLS